MRYVVKVFSGSGRLLEEHRFASLHGAAAFAIEECEDFTYKVFDGHSGRKVTGHELLWVYLRPLGVGR